ncbi:hypothetical protein HY734_03630 [Candidatus Uhrbacteria bacterium]|nr:hypothetical protein [Candidatus Uhrbacteria bacterium]
MKQKLKQRQVRELEEIIVDGERKSPEIRRAQVVLLLNEEVPVASIHRITRFSKTRIFAIRATYLKCDTDALRDKRQGKPKELLTKKQRDEIVSIVGKKTPKQLGFVSEF